MKAYFVHTGEVYLVKVSDKIAHVRVDDKKEVFDHKGRSKVRYHCTNLDTGRGIVVKSAQRFREVVAPDKQDESPIPDPQVPDTIPFPVATVTESNGPIPDDVPKGDPPAPDATNANVDDANASASGPFRNDDDYIQYCITEIVRKYGSNLRNWPEFHNIIRAAGLQPQDATDERLALASLHLHQDDAAWRERLKAQNADPANHLKVIVKGDPEIDPLHPQPTPTTEENDMAKKKTTPPPVTTKKLKAKAADKPRSTKPKVAKPAEDGAKMSALDAAAKVLDEEGKPMSAKELIEAMEKKGYWTSPGGKTPHATLSAAIGTEISKKGNASRFAKASPGHFTLRS